MTHTALCYVDPPFAYFTTQELSKQWGDDWDDAPYEHNAGTPYTSDMGEYDIIKVAFDSDLETPADRAGANSFFSVEMINDGMVAWLGSPRWSKEIISIPAGVTLESFISAIEKSGGRVYLPKARG